MSSSLYGPFGINGNNIINYARLSNTQQTNLNTTPIQWRNVLYIWVY